MAAGDWQTAVTHAEAIQSAYSAMSVFGLQAAETIHCERVRRAELVRLIDEANGGEP
jgi:hypothetical protein